MMLDEDAIREAISASVYKAFEEGAVASVDVEFLDDVEPMKDAVNVRVVVNGEVEQRVFAHLGLTLRKILTNHNDNRFPLVSFISKGEYSRRHR